MYDGAISYWLCRATIDELRARRADEMAKPALLRAMMLVKAIDRELTSRSQDEADFYLNGWADDPEMGAR